MNTRLIPKTAIFAFVGILGIFLFLVEIYAIPKKTSSFISPIPKNTLLKKDSLQEGKSADSAFSPPSLFSQTINVLLLGFDGRKGDKNPRCDSIHMISLDFLQNRITITTVPRGTLVDLPKTNGGGSTYLGNSCHRVSIDYAVSEVERITDIKRDYLVKVGFSQTLGILRSLGLPTTPTLQFLRNRRYAIGDHQRSHNQAVFIKDMIVTRLGSFANIPKVGKYLIYKMINTDMPFETAVDILDYIVSSKLYKNPNNIRLVTKPSPRHKPKDIYFAPDKYKDINSWQSDEEFIRYQENLAGYLSNLIARGNKLLEQKRFASANKLIKTPFSQKLWLQIEDPKLRYQIHFDLLKIFALSSMDKETSSSLVLDFITEMEVLNISEMKTKGESLLDLIKA